MNRRGVLLAEAVLALAIGVAGILALTMLFQWSCRAAQATEARAIARGLLVELGDLLSREPLPELQRLAAQGGAGLDALTGRPLAAVPPGARAQRIVDLAALRGKLSLTVEDAPGGYAGLVRICLEAQLERGTLRSTRLVRKRAAPATTGGR